MLANLELNYKWSNKQSYLKWSCKDEIWI